MLAADCSTDMVPAASLASSVTPRATRSDRSMSVCTCGRALCDVCVKNGSRPKGHRCQLKAQERRCLKLLRADNASGDARVSAGVAACAWHAKAQPTPLPQPHLCHAHFPSPVSTRTATHRAWVDDADRYLLTYLRGWQGPESWHPAPPSLKDAARQCAELASAAGVSLPRLTVKAAVDQAAGGVAVHLMGRLCL